MKYKKISRTLCVLLQVVFLASCASTADKDEATTPEDEYRNLLTAAAYMRVLELFIATVAHSCTDLLGQDDATMDGIGDGWKNRNREYINAGRKLIMAHAYLNMQRKQAKLGEEKGFTVARAEAAEFGAAIERDSARMVNARLSGSHNDQLESCNNFADQVSTGRYDITPRLDRYLQLQRMVQITER
ncbi:hypothetical protein [Aliidiomarina soli]|uniref:Lysozyme inhibitor LprI N-terminal domain-containing protein n=1 Tax=Aliidiomarina soli TaxID=1928574 RepID=A0A432WBY4_9GAMM|nr:hypothetical protein [Aliidiomarina soli]RUO29563.1 hypothetical protein CWE14_13965 [Aliidiomarina soli]